MNEIKVGNNEILSRINFLESEFEKIKTMMEREYDLSNWGKEKLIESRNESDDDLINLDNL